MAKELMKRSEVRVEDTWNLQDMFATDEAWEQELKVIEGLYGEVQAMEGKLADSAQNLLKVLDTYAKADEKLSLAYNYAERLYDEDTTNTEHQAMQAKIMTLVSEVGSRTAFLDPEILAIDSAVLEKFYQEAPELELYRKMIDEIQRMKEHTLSAEMEKMVAMTAEMSRVSEDTFSVLNNADILLPETTDDDGEQIRLTHGRFIPLLESANREVRKEAFQKYYGAYKQYIHTYASLYNGQVKQQVFYTKARNYESTLVKAVDRNHVSPKVYHNLVNTVNKNFDKLHRYVKLRKKCLGVDELHMYDIYTPMIPDMAKEVSFDEAKATILEALKPLGEDYVAKVKEGFESRWVDVYENQGKRSGAYSAGAYGTHPYVLMNYNGSLDNMFTLAHEMGHAMHSYYSNSAQPYIYSQYKIFVAEVASTCNEILLLEYLLKNTTDQKEKAYLLNHYLDMFKGTLFRQTQFAEFEMLTNEMVEKGESLNADNLSKLYQEINAKYYGPDMISDDEIALEWARIPHFYYNFYLYQYATSFSAAVAIAHEILEEGAPAVERYKKFLSGGCSDTPVNLLKICGIDMESEKPIQEALDVMNGVLDEIEKLL